MRPSRFYVCGGCLKKGAYLVVIDTNMKSVRCRNCKRSKTYHSGLEDWPGMKVAAEALALYEAEVSG
jgi:hypothetical protein